MDQQALEALLAQMGALGPNDFREEIKKEKVKEQTSEYAAPTEVEKDVTYRTWIKPGTNRRLTVKVNPDGTYTKTFDGADPDIKPSATTGTNVATNTTEPYIVTRKPDGSIQQDPNPNYQAPGSNQTPAQQQTQAAEAQTAQALNNERQWNSAHGYGWVTHAQRAEQVQKQQADARAENNQQRQTAAQEAANQLQRDRLQFDRDKANLPDVKATPVDRGGQRYWQVTSITPQGATKITNYGPDGKEIAAIPSEGEASTGGPPMVQFIAGHTEEALTAYHTAVYSDPSLTPAQKEKRFQEAVQIANLVVQNAATQQRNEESSRNTEYNIASTKLDYMKSGLNSALDFVSKLNGDLPGGTGLGGKALAAILGIQMLQLQQSGINDIKTRTPIPTITNRDLSSNAALTAHNQTIATQAAAAAQPSTTTTPSLNQGQDLSSPATARPSVTATAAPQTGAAPTSTTLPANRPDQTQAAAQIENAINPPSASATNVGQAGDPGYSPQAMPSSPDPNDPNIGHPGDPGYADYAPLFAPKDPATYSKPAETVDQMPVDVPYPNNAGAESKMQPTDWAALANYGPIVPQQQTASSDQGQDGTAFMAAKRAQIAATPPWQLSPEDLNWAEQNGLMDEAMSVRGRAVA